jgi:hypothetical protein
VEHAAPIFDGRLRSDTVPHGPFAELMEPLVLLGRPADAMRCHLQGYPLIARQMRWLGEVGRHLGFLALTDNLDAALRLLETHAPWPVASVEVDDRYYFHLAVRFLLERVQDAGRPTLHLRLPEGFPCRRDDGVYDTAALRGWFEGECEQVAARYDARNGNDHFSRTTLGASRRLREHVAPFPLPARPRGPKGNK